MTFTEVGHADDAPDRPSDGGEAAVVKRRHRDIPARGAGGIREVDVGNGRASQVMVVPPWLRDADGSVVPGALGLILDSTLGTAVMSTVEGSTSMVTSHLHLEMMAPIPDGTSELHVEGRRRSLNGRFGLGEGEVRTGAGTEIARATIGAVLMPGKPDQPTRTDRAADSVRDRHGGASRVVPSSHLAGSPVHARLGTEVITADPGGVTSRVLADPALANSQGGLHGGVGVLLGERILDLALHAAIAAAGRQPDRPEDAMTLVELRAAFVRRVTTDGRPIACHGSILHLGRKLAAGRAEVRTQDGRPAVLLDATYVATNLIEQTRPG